PYTGEVLDINKPTSDADTKSKPQGNPSSGEPAAASAGFHSRPATRAGPYENKNSFVFSYGT
ncbi:unnamed protein product, partial [Rotaria magnacalcarata]